MLVNCEPLSECACLNLKSFLNNSCFLCEFSRKGLQKRDFSQREDSTETQLFWCVDGTEEQTPCDASSYRASRIRTNVWTLLSKLLTNDLQRELLAEWLQHMFSKKKKKKKIQEHLSAHGQIMKRGRGKSYQTNMKLQITHSAQFATSNFYGSRSLWSRR